MFTGEIPDLGIFRLSFTGAADIIFAMSTLVEIESAAKQLPEGDRQRLLISLMRSLRLTNQPLPAPRLFSIEEMHG